MVGEVVTTTNKAESSASRPISAELGLRLAAIADQKGATDIVLLEIGALVSYTDHLLICTARNERLAAAIADELRVRMKQERSLLPSGAEGDPATGWLVMDYLDCVVHIFTAEARDRYQLEDLWREAPRVDLSQVVVPEPERPQL